MISKILTHPADLSVQPLRQNNGKTVPASLSHDAWARNSPKYRHSILHMTHKFICNFVVYRHLIFLFVVVACPHDTVDKISLIGHKEKSLGIFIQPSNRKNACRILKHILHGHIVPASVRRADYALWFVKRQQNHFLPSAASFSVDGDLHLVRYLPAIFCTHAVHKYFSFFDQAVCFTP